jgi:hypothetical protein
MYLRSSSSLVVLALLAFGSTAQAQPEPQLRQVDQDALDSMIVWVSEDAERLDSAEQLLLINETPIVNAALAGVYKLKAGFGKARITLTVTPKGDGTYSVERIHDRRWSSTTRLIGKGSRGSDTITGKARLLVEFDSAVGGMAGRLREESPDEGGNASAVYIVTPEFGKIRGSFRANGGNDDSAGSYESGWLQGATRVAFDRRVGRDISALAAKLKAKLGQVRAKLAKMIVSWRATGKRVLGELRAFARKVNALITRAAVRTGELIEGGIETTRRAVRTFLAQPAPAQTETNR